MRTYLVILALLVIAALIAPYFLKGPDGQPLMRAEVPAAVVPGALGAGDTVYRWQDEHGVWQFGESPPQGVEAQAVVLDSESGITPLGPGWQVEERHDSTPSDAAIPADTLDLLTGAPHILQAAEAARNKVNDHTGDLEKLLDSAPGSE